MDVKKTPAAPMPPAVPKTAAVRRAIEWALVTACFPVISYALRPAVASALAHHDAACRESVPLTDAQNAELSALWFGMLCCAALQAAAAVLAVLVPCCRRRALAHVALAVTMAGHCMYAVAIRLLLAADPGFLFGRIVGPATVVFFAGGDLVHLLGLLQPGGEERTDD